MTNSQHSDSEGKTSSAFSRFHKGIQKWIWERRWTELHAIQEKAANPILDGTKDVIIAAATAGGKTEASFLPILSRIAEKESIGARCLCVSPLRALINDQYERLEEIGSYIDVPIHRWHGDVPQGRKKKFLAKPSGVLIITPESLEALFVIRGTRIPSIFTALDYIVIDELHAFIGSERGRQLQSLLHRVELAARREIPRIGLSATLGDMDLACEFLRQGDGDKVIQIISSDDGQEIKLQLRGYRRANPRLSIKDAVKAASKGKQIDPEDVISGDVRDIAQHLFRALRGTDNLIFANSRTRVEVLADLLRRKSEKMKVPNEFMPHHGSLSKELREDAENLVKKDDRPGNIICTNTLELGIDIGNVTSIAQIGSPPSVTAMRQRMGRSGRRQGEAAVMRIYVAEEEITPVTSIQDSLRAELVQSIAMVILLLEKWCEPPSAKMLHLSTLIQQIMSVIAQHGGAKADEIWRALCKSGPFSGVTQSMFSSLLRSMGSSDLVVQTGDGDIVLGLSGERIVDHYDFFAAFVTSDEFRIINHGKTLGSIPISNPISEGMYLIFGGKRWKIVSADVRRKQIDVIAAAGGRPPMFGAGGLMIHDRVREEMFKIYQAEEIPAFLDSTAQDLLDEGRKNFFSAGLTGRFVLDQGSDVLVFPWKGDRIMNTLMLLIKKEGYEVSNDGIALNVIDTSSREVKDCLAKIASEPTDYIASLANIVANKENEKYDSFLPEDLLWSNYVAAKLDIEGAVKTAKILL